MRGPLGSIPGHVLTLADYAAEAAQRIEPATWAWLEGSSGAGAARALELDAFSALAIRNRVLVDCSGGSTGTRLLGQDLAHPVILAPLGYQRLIHPEGEMATARGALDTVMAVSTMSSVAVEDVAAEAANALWFQLYFQPERADTLALVRRAEAAGCKALLVTLDTPVQPASLAAIRAGFEIPPEINAVHLQGMAQARAAEGGWSNPVLNALAAAAPSMRDAEWLRSVTELPLIAKGLSHPDDARALVALGWDGVALSTHGGRALDDAPPPLALVSAMREALGPDVVILLDGSVRTGADVFKSLALGANAVMIGRPQLHALAVAGSLGVAHMLKLLREELELTMVMAGCPTIASITPKSVYHKHPTSGLKPC